MKLRRWRTVVIFLVLTFAVRVWNLNGPSLWYDEAYQWWATLRPLDEMLALSTSETVPPLLYLTLHAWMPLAGSSEFALRFPSVLYGVLAVVSIARIARRLTNSNTAELWALFLGAIFTALIWAARETRMYGSFIGWTTLASMALVETLSARTPRARRLWAWIWGATLLGALATLTLSAFWLIGQGLVVAVVLARRSWSAIRDYLRAMFPPTAAAGLLFLPWVAGAARALGTNATYWAGHLPWDGFMRIAVAGMTVCDYLPDDWKLIAGAVIVLAALMSLALTRRRPVAGLVPLLQLLPLGVMALIFSNLPKWGSRHATPFAPSLVLSLAIGWGTAARIQGQRSRVLANIFLGACSLPVIALTLYADANLLANPAYAPQDWRGATRYVQERRQPGDVVIVETGSVFPAWAYYAGYEGLLPLPDDEQLNVNHVLHYADVAPTLNEALGEAAGVWLVTWLDHITDPTGIVPALLETIGTETPVPEFHGLGLRRFTLDRRADFPAQPSLTAQPSQPTLPDLTLWGYRLPDTPQPSGTPLDVWAFWTVDEPASHRDRFYQVVVRLLDARGNEWARRDSTPGSGDYRLSRWPAATPVLGRYTLVPNPWTPPGVYTPTLTVYLAGEATASVTLQPVTLSPAIEPPVLPEDAVAVESTDATAPLRLLSLWVGGDAVVPCGQLEGRAYWETVDAMPSRERAGSLSATFRFQEHRLDLPVVPEAAAWPAGTRFVTPFRIPIDCRALDTQALLKVQLDDAVWRGPTITLDAGREFALPGDLIPLSDPATSGDFGPGFAALAGYMLTPELRAGQPFSLTLYWHANTTSDHPYSVFVHVTQPGVPGDLVAQHDGWPALGAKPTHAWAPGEIIADMHPLPGIPAGAYEVRVGLYDAAGRLPLASESAAPPKDAVTIPFTVRP